MSSNINELLKYSIESKASDLHLSTGSIPMVRIDGLMKPLQLPNLKNEDMVNVRDQVLNSNQKKILDERLEIDFSYQIKGSGRFRVNFFNQINGLSASFRIIPGVSRLLSSYQSIKYLEPSTKILLEEFSSPFMRFFILIQ